MKQGSNKILLGFVCGLIAIIASGILLTSGVFNYDVWTRDKPLKNPVRVTGVHGGTIALSDGRVFHPAGVRRSDSVAADEYDKAISTVMAQGVVVVRDLGDGRAFLLAEPKFYNWCGTRNMDGIPWKRWGGSYFQCPVSELLIQTAYAVPMLDQPGLTAKERWRLEGVEYVGRIAESPTRISDELHAFRYDGSASDLSDYDAILELMWKPPPSQ